VYTEKVKAQVLHTIVRERARKEGITIGERLNFKLISMYQTRTSLVGGHLTSQAWSTQPGLHTDWDHLFREMITVLLYEKKIHLGILNPFAEVYIPQSERINGTQNGANICEKTENV